MKITETELQSIRKLSSELGGVFTYVDLNVIFPTLHKNSFYRLLAKLEELGIIRRFIKGYYVTENFDLKILSQKICNGSYISFENVLASAGLIGTVSSKRIRAVKIGKNRTYENDSYNITHVAIARDLFFGYETVKGVKIATKEKAFLDTLYFHTRGMAFQFDLYSDMDVSLLDSNLVKQYLKPYKNPKFKKFITEYLKDHEVA